MEELGFRLDDDSVTCDQKQINSQESRLLSIQRCIEFLVHACQCRHENCSLPGCWKFKRVVRHAKSCRLKTNGGCRVCRQLIALCCYHAKHCQEAKCPVSYCSSIKNKMKHQELQKRLQQAQILKRRIATMQNRGLSAAVLQTSPGNSNSSNQPSPGAQPHSSPHSPQPGIGMKPSTGALQVVQQVKAAAAGQTAPHMVPASVNYGKDNAYEILRQNYKDLLFNDENHDLILKVKNREFKAHQNILRFRCPVFKFMLSHDMLEKRRGVVEIPDCDPSAFKQFLSYVYTGHLEMLDESVMLGLYYIADKYDMPNLKEICYEFIKKSLSTTNVCDVISLALNHSDSLLLECTEKYFVDKAREVLVTTEWKSFITENPIHANELFIKVYNNSLPRDRSVPSGGSGQ